MHEASRGCLSGFGAASTLERWLARLVGLPRAQVYSQLKKGCKTRVENGREGLTLTNE